MLRDSGSSTYSRESRLSQDGAEVGHWSGVEHGSERLEVGEWSGVEWSGLGHWSGVEVGHWSGVEWIIGTLVWIFFREASKFAEVGESLTVGHL